MKNTIQDCKMKIVRMKAGKLKHRTQEFSGDLKKREIIAEQKPKNNGLRLK